MQHALRAQTTYATHRPRVGINVLYLMTLLFGACAQQYGGDPESASIKAWLATVRPAPTPLHYSLTQLYPLATNFTTQVPRRDHSVSVCCGVRCRRVAQVLMHCAAWLRWHCKLACKLTYKQHTTSSTPVVQPPRRQQMRRGWPHSA